MADTSGRETSGRKPQPAAGDLAQARLRALTGQARLVLAWERLWPRLAPLCGVAGLFVAASWFGVFPLLPIDLRLVALGLFAVALGGGVVPLLRYRYPTQAEALARLDREAGIPHRPARALGDRLASSGADPVAKALWAAHQRDAAAKTRRVRFGLPSPGLPERDRYGLRFIVVLALVAGFFYAGGDRAARLAAAFQPDLRPAPVSAFRIDAWVTPPPYTRRAPIMLSGAPEEESPVAAPEGSIVTVRVAGDDKAEIRAEGGLQDGAKAPEQGAVSAADAAGALERRLTLRGEGTVSVQRRGGEVARYRFSAIPDRAPTIAFDGPIKQAARGATTLTYKVEDDYGATAVEAQVDVPAAEGAHPLYDPPKLSLPLPAGHNRSGTVTTTRDMSEHPFAGADATMTLVARDDAGNEGRSAPQTLSLPERFFTKPLARALVEQRRKLALDANVAPKVAEALDALMIAPERFTPDAGTYLALRTASTRLKAAQTDPALRDVVQYLWQIALHIEEGDVSDAEQRLKAAQNRLREALERGAPPEEIARLTQELRQAMNDFMRDYAKRLAQQPNQPAQPDRQGQQRTVTPDELNKMLDRMEEMARSGSKDEAQQLLSELTDILENLQPADQGQAAQDPALDEMQRSLDELSRMIQRQQRLRDQTFRQGQQGQPGQDGQPGQMPSENGQGEQKQGQANLDGKGTGDLQGQQKALREQLDAMKKRLAEQGVPGGEALDGAGQAMQDAEGQLGEGQSDDAVGSQGRAIEALRKGAKGLSQQLQQAQGQQGNGRAGTAQRPGDGTGRDPLGRNSRDSRYSDGTVKVPGRGETAAERAARVLEELRGRLANPDRPRQELDYIERLLRSD